MSKKTFDDIPRSEYINRDNWLESLSDEWIDVLTYKNTIYEIQKELLPIRIFKLDDVHICDNNITDLSPLRRVRSLKTVVLRRLKVFDIEPLSSLYGLERLIIENCPINDLSPIFNLDKFSEIILQNASLSLLPQLANLTNLKALTLTDMDISSIDFIDKLIGLHSIELRNIPINDISPLQYLRNLKRLSLIDTAIEDIDAISSLDNLLSVNVNGSPVASLHPISKCKNIESLSCRDTPINNLTPLSNCSHLRHLYISNTNVSALNPLHELYYIETLHFNNTNVSSLEPLQHLYGICDLDFSFTKTTINELRFLAYEYRRIVASHLGIKSNNDLYRLHPKLHGLRPEILERKISDNKKGGATPFITHLNEIGYDIRIISFKSEGLKESYKCRFFDPQNPYHETLILCYDDFIVFKISINIDHDFECLLSYNEFINAIDLFLLKSSHKDLYIQYSFFNDLIISMSMSYFFDKFEFHAKVLHLQKRCSLFKDEIDSLIERNRGLLHHIDSEEEGPF